MTQKNYQCLSYVVSVQLSHSFKRNFFVLLATDRRFTCVTYLTELIIINKTEALLKLSPLTFFPPTSEAVVRI